MASQSLATRQAQQVQTREEGGNPLVLLRTQLEQRAEEFKTVLPAHITPEKFQRTIITAVQSDPDILTADRRSLITACMKAAQDGLLPDKREAALVIFIVNQKIDGEWRRLKQVQYMPMVYGLRKKILQSGEVRDIQANVVYRQEVEAGLFIYEEGTERMLRHKPLLDPAFDPTDDDICAAYSVATFKDGTQSFEVMRRADINKVREMSQTGATRDRAGKPRESKGPWVDWFAEMAKKTVMRRHSKTLPMSGDLLDVEAADQLLAARSSLALLESRDEDEPEISDRQDQTPPRRVYDPSDGSVVDGDSGEVIDEDEDHDGEEESAEDLGDWPAWLESFEHDVNKQCETPIDVSSYWGNVRRTVSEAPQSIQERATEIKDARIAELQRGKPKR